MKKEKKKGMSVQNLLGIKSFSEYGVITAQGELIFYQIAPINISVLSTASIEIKIRELMYVLTTIPDIEIVCTDSAQCFDENKSYLLYRINQESNEKVKSVLKKDLFFMNDIQTEMATARQFLFVVRCRNLKPHQVFERANMTQKMIIEQGFDCKRMKKEQIKRFLALYFESSLFGDQIPDYDGIQYFDTEKIVEANKNG